MQTQITQSFLWLIQLNFCFYYLIKLTQSSQTVNVADLDYRPERINLRNLFLKSYWSPEETIVKVSIITKENTLRNLLNPFFPQPSPSPQPYSLTFNYTFS